MAKTHPLLLCLVEPCVRSSRNEERGNRGVGLEDPSRDLAGFKSRVDGSNLSKKNFKSLLHL
jgi:hypothetical protein